MSNQIQITGGAKVRNLEGVITGATGILGSVPYGGPNGVATLDSAGKVPVSQLPNSVMEFKGTWNAATNTPTLANGTGNAGDVYLCNVAGTVNFGAGPITFAVGDYVVYSGSTWERSSGATGTVTSVAASITGNSIGLTGSPITTAGTLAFAFSGTSGQYINGAGNLVTFPTLSGYVPYTGATSDVDLGAFKLNAQSLHAKGTAGAGHLGLKHQSASATATANESSLFADVNGDMAWKNDSLYLITLSSYLNTADRTYTLPNASGTIALTSDISYPVTSVFGRTGAVIATSGDYTTSLVTEGTNLYFTNARARSAISLTTTGTSGVATYSSSTGVLNIPDYGSALSGYLPLTGGTLTGPLVGTIATFVASTGNKALTLTGAANAYLIDGTASTTTGQSYGPIFRAGTNSSDSSLIVADANASTTYFVIKGDGEARFKYSLTLGNVIGTGTGAFYAGAGTFTGALIGTTATFNSGASSQTLTLQSTGAASQIWLSDSGTTAGYVRISSNANSLIFYANLTQQLSLFSSGASAFSGSVTATSFIKTSGTSSQYLMADGSVSTLSNPVTGTGTTNYVPKFTGTGTIGNSLIYDNGSTVSISTGSTVLSIDRTGGATALMELKTGGTVRGYLGADVSTPFIFFNEVASEKMRLFSNGNLAINSSTDAGYKLDVNGTGRFSDQLTISKSASYLSDVTMQQWGDNTDGFRLVQYWNSGGINWKFNHGSSTMMSFSPTGAATFSSSVTAGTTITGRTSYTSAGSNASPYFDDWLIANPNGSNTATKIQIGNSFASSAGTWMKFVVNSNSAFNSPIDVMTLKYDGNVGIGTTSPNGKLTLSYSSSLVDGLIFINTDSGGRQWRIGDGSGASAGNFGFYDATSSALRMTIKSTGIVNIANVPTSTSGLVTGDIYKTVAGVLMIVL